MELNKNTMYEYIIKEMVPDLYIGGCEIGDEGVFYVEWTDEDSGERYYMDVSEWLTTDAILDDFLASDEVSDEEAADLAARVEKVLRWEYEKYLRSQLTLLTGENND